MAWTRRSAQTRFEVLVFGRRSHTRFVIEPSADGVLRVLRDVIVQESAGDEFWVVARGPAAVGEMLTIELADVDVSPGIDVRVVECRPIIVDGAMRHRLRLQRSRA
jgi:hypothetical protein